MPFKYTKIKFTDYLISKNMGTLDSSGVNCTERTVCECALKTPVLPVTVGTHNLTLLSRDAEAIRLPDGENVTSITASS